MELEIFLNRLDTEPGSIEFPDVIALINRLYTYIPTGFRNHELYNEAGQNSGSCKVFAFARLHELDVEQTLALFGAFYRSDVLRTPDGDSHPNIRQFMITGWDGIEFDEVYQCGHIQYQTSCKNPAARPINPPNTPPQTTSHPR